MRSCCHVAAPVRRAGLASRVRATGVANAPWRRAFHQAKARFTTIDRKGVPVSYETEIRIGDAHEAYIYIEPDVGDAIRSGIARQLGGFGLTQGATGKLALRFHHGSLHFAHKSLPLPRVDIDRDLPRQSGSYSDVSPATLWLSGNWHAITLDGSPDESFERASRESAQELRVALEKLKDH
ncbi:hypothetical protein JDV02_010660 [Purpureocillium takamizusanense]|uniref:Uncharacterized protein n=1 Tax=Purpureocillium takamizusanense TaxID=2060973 RepID=A0A9Q8QSF4_9HYPO|nr:uncharacterized protein JDV02_010660 [Purpureocillium takamizusanense]UNI24945.1 hypothetical protein JDV02_010660 [Purpureocillium takamizusanense]